MISHAMTIVVNALNQHLTQVYGCPTQPPMAGLYDSKSLASDSLLESSPLRLTLINLQEDAQFRQAALPSNSAAPAKLTAMSLKGLVLLSAQHPTYSEALLALDRSMRFFKQRPLFTEQLVSAEHLEYGAPAHPLDRLREFQISISHYPANLTESYQIWQMLACPQRPFALYEWRVQNLSTASAEVTTLRQPGIAQLPPRSAPKG